MIIYIMVKLAFITGITGQDGSYLAELLVEKGYKIYGIVRRTSLVYTSTRLDHIRDNLNLEYGDLTDGSSLTNIIHKIISENCDFEVLEIYNLAAQSHVKISFEIPEYTSLVDGIGTLKLLEAIRSLPSNTQKKIRFYQAGTSEMYGAVLETPQKETTPFNPQSPYACAKVYSHYLVKNYREGYGMYACNGILFNHESPRRGANFVTAKIINGIKNIMSGKLDCVHLGNIHSMRDWGHSKDYVYGMWLMLQQNEPDDYVLATGRTITVKEFIERSFKLVNVDIVWEGSGLDEVGINKNTQQIVVKIDNKYFRPCEVELLLGDSTKAREKLGWTLKYDLDGLIEDMMK
jgi:GDPmannose 4,6-dehydratase